MATVPMEPSDSLVFVMGGMKTGTTSLCGLLNSHPDVFVMCEVDLNNCYISRYGRKLIGGYPNAQKYFFHPVSTDPLCAYRRLQQDLAGAGHARRYFGDKFATINAGYSTWLHDAQVIFTIRHVTEWLVKDSVRKTYQLDDNIVPFAVQYTSHFLESFLLPRVLHIRLDHFLDLNPQIVSRVWSFLSLSVPRQGDAWWETIGHYRQDDPKQLLDWWKGHASSAVAPQPNDTVVELSEHPFWNNLLPIFNRYYALAGVGGRAEPADVLHDLDVLGGLVDGAALPLDLAYRRHASKSQHAHFKAERRAQKKPSFRRRLFRLAGFGG